MLCHLECGGSGEYMIAVAIPFLLPRAYSPRGSRSSTHRVLWSGIGTAFAISEWGQEKKNEKKGKRGVEGEDLERGREKRKGVQSRR